MNAANDLDAYSPLNIQQMQQVATNPDVRFVVQWKQSTALTSTATFNGTRRYLIQPSLLGGNQSKLVQDLGNSVDMGLASSLNNFIKWGKANYPADHYAVVLWDHGNGWLPVAEQKKKAPAFSYDDQTGHAIQTWQLSQAFKGLHPDIIAFDCSLMQMSEVAFELSGVTPYLAGSEESPPGTGYPYQRVFGEFTNNPTGSPLTLSKAFVDGMINEPNYNNQKIEESVIDTSKLPAVASAAATLRGQLVANVGSLGATVPNLRTTVQSYLPTVNRYFFDTVDLCTQLSAATSVSGLQAACAGMNQAVSQAVVWEGHNSNSPGSHGLSIDFSPSSYFTKVQSSYNKLAWNQATSWSQWLGIAP
jgi:hypothetical protein